VTSPSKRDRDTIDWHQAAWVDGNLLFPPRSESVFERIEDLSKHQIQDLAL
jgi:hypothetical protein